MIATFKDVRIAGIATVVPSNAVRYDDEVGNYAGSPAKARKLKMLMGFNEHRIAEPGVTTSDLVVHGFAELVEQGLVRAEDIDALVFVSQTPDYQLPPTSSVLHGRLGLREDAYCVDINQGCTGYVIGLHQALMLLQTTDAERVLLAAGDVLSAKTSPNDRASYPLVGDAASLTILERSAGAAPILLSMMNRGTAYDALMIPAGGARTPSTQATREMVADSEGNLRSQEHLTMQGGDVFTFTQTVVVDFLNGFMQQAGLSKDEVDHYFMHQANAFILRKLAEQLDLAVDRVPMGIVGKYGNSSSATIPLAICDTLPGGPEEPRQVVMCGFGVGLSWGAVSAQLAELSFCTIIEK